MKQRQKEQPIVEMAKREVVEKNLVDHVLRDDDDDDDLTFARWWKLKQDDDMIEVQYPHDRHGLAGKSSNHSKQEVMAQFLEFVDANSQPYGRQAGSYSAQFFFHPEVHSSACP